MSATTSPKREVKHAPSGGNHMRKSYTYIAIGGLIFLAAWAVWTFIYSAQVPG